jgi:predicted GNAT family acetyltransferase
MGMPDGPSGDDWRDASSLVTPEGYAAVLQARAETPGGWTVIRTFGVTQMVAESTSGADWAESVPLGAEDVPEMVELVAQTEPGPFLKRTVELGDYLGVRQDGMLVAMAGERLRLEGWTEISAVCTLPAYRGRGLASALMAALIAGIERRGERAFLHVMSTNTDAIRLYEELGFRVRQTATIAVVAPRPAAGAVSGP